MLNEILPVLVARCCCEVAVTRVFMVWLEVANIGCGYMDYLNEETVYLKKGHVKVGARLAQVSLKDVPLEVRRKEAKKTLFLTRYE
jgi:hypothetical protein